MKRFYLLFLMLYCCALQQLFAIYFTRIGIQDGLPQISVLSICQDALGRMWFGTEEGVCYYDGVKITVLKYLKETEADSIQIGNKTQFISTDEIGNVFFISDDQLIGYNVYTQQFSTLFKQNVRSMTTKGQEIWISSNDSILTYHSENHAITFKCKLPTTRHYANAILVDKSARCWIGTPKGLYLYEETKPLQEVLTNIHIQSLYQDSKRNVWISTRGSGLFKIDPKNHISLFEHHPGNPNTLSSNLVRGITEDNYGNIWIGTFNGLNKYNPNNDLFTCYQQGPYQGNLSHSSVFPLYKDRQGTIWIGTYYGGVNYFNPEMNLFSVYEARNGGLSYPFVGKMVEDKTGNVWICTEGGGLNYFNRTTKQLSNFQSSHGSNSIAHNNLKTIAYSPERDKLYIGTYTGGLCIYDIKNNRFENLLFNNSRYERLVGDKINNIGIYKDLLIFTSPNGIFSMNLDSKKIARLVPIDTFFGNGSFFIDSKNRLWLSYNNRIFLTDLQHTDQYIEFKPNEKGLKSSIITQIIEDRDHRIFITTRGDGLFLYEEEKKQFKNYNSHNSGIASNYCYEIAISTLGDLIISGNKGISFFSPEHEDFRVIDLKSIPLTAINIGCGLLVTKDGEIFVGGTNGFATFYEQQLYQSPKIYNLYFTQLYVNNELVIPRKENSILHYNLALTRNIELSHHQNNLIINFASNNYVSSLNEIQYEYRLEGFDDKWLSCNNFEISYTNLNPGKYTLVIREAGVNQSGWKPQKIMLNIQIHAPWYATWWASIFYLVTIIGLLSSYYKFQKSQYMLKASLELERKEKENLEKINQAKLQFFSNISHEFRTPLTLIISQSEVLMKSRISSISLSNKILDIYRNSQLLMNLISELLDFRKLEQGQMQLKVSKQDIVSFVNEIFLSFKEYASNKQIEYQFSCNEPKVYCWFDAKQLQKVFFNLLSNAFKYTKKNDRVIVQIENESQIIKIKVIDTGIGIDREYLEHIFERFYQVSSITRTPSTGIGLALSKAIVEMHHGIIEVDSTPGNGSTFIVTLQKDKKLFATNEYVASSEEYIQEFVLGKDIFHESNISINVINDEEKSVIDPHADKKSNAIEKRKVLLVEDNHELLNVLSNLFSSTYEVVIAHNGKEGLDKAHEEFPDIIVSDIMMPEMTGIELCETIKSDFNLCHIPIVLLTALASTQQNIEGLTKGADDYITKPFNTSILLVRCNNLVHNRLMLQKKFQQQGYTDTEVIANNPIDQHFLDALNSVIENHIDDTEFNIDHLACALGLSRSSLYAKFKSLTGITPNDYILSKKIKRAAHLLQSTQLQITEISDMLGFGSSRYFTRCFKKSFGIAPSEYRKKENSAEKLSE